MPNGKYIHVNTVGNWVISPNPGAVLHVVNVNSAGATSAFCTIYDAGATSATNATNVVGILNAGVQASSYMYDAVMVQGIVAVLGSLADLTIIFN